MGTTIITSLITALTSIFVALITAGYFKKFMDLRKERKSRKDLTEQFAKDEIIHYSLKEIKRNKIQYKKVAATKILFMLVKINKKHPNNLKSFKCF